MASKQENPSPKKTNQIGNAASTYLILYNILQFVGWSYIFFLSMKHLVLKRSCSGLWDTMNQPLKFFQTLALLEVVHSLFGLTRSSPLINLMQVSSRLFAVWCILCSVPEAVDGIGTVLLTIAWCLAEITRYSYYALDLMHICPFALVWCRYTLFMVLYPMGISGEILAMLSALPYIRQHKLYSLTLPNIFNFSFDYSYAIILIIALYIPFSPKLYGYMLTQRKKVLGADKQKTR